MRDAGFLYTATQCKNKFKYLKSRYTKKKDNIGNRGSGESPLKFEYFEGMDDTFSKKPNITPKFIALSLPQCSKNENIENEQPSLEKRKSYEQQPSEKKRKVEETISPTKKEKNKGGSSQQCHQRQPVVTLNNIKTWI